MELTIKITLDDRWEAYHVNNESRLESLIPCRDGVEIEIIDSKDEPLNIHTKDYRKIRGCNGCRYHNTLNDYFCCTCGDEYSNYIM